MGSSYPLDYLSVHRGFSLNVFPDFVPPPHAIFYVIKFFLPPSSQFFHVLKTILSTLLVYSILHVLVLFPISTIFILSKIGAYALSPLVPPDLWEIRFQSVDCSDMGNFKPFCSKDSNELLRVVAISSCDLIFVSSTRLSFHLSRVCTLQPRTIACPNLWSTVMHSQQSTDFNFLLKTLVYCNSSNSFLSCIVFAEKNVLCRWFCKHCNNYLIFSSICKFKKE